MKDAEDAWEAAQEIDAPVVVKPQFGNHGRGVSTNLNTQAEVEAAYELADREGSLNVVVGAASGTYNTFPIAPRQGFLTLMADF